MPQHIHPRFEPARTLPASHFPTTMAMTILPNLNRAGFAQEGARQKRRKQGTGRTKPRRVGRERLLANSQFDIAIAH
jgi:hypothetical protein